jgi:RNA polymerase sigma-70 factor, ECF subfamily
MAGKSDELGRQDGSGSGEQSDAQLLSLLQGGSRAAFAALVQRHTERFYALAYRYLQSRHAAEDVVQDAFLKLWENPGRWRAERGAQFTTWFHRVVVNLCLDRQKRRWPLPLGDAPPPADPRERQDAAVMRAQEQELLEREIAALPERQRTALNLCFDESLSNQQAAELMGLSLKALQSLLMRAKTTLKQRMKAYL